MTRTECEEWVKSPFHPLKNLADATLQLFRDGDLPNIKTIRDGDIQDALNTINHVIDEPHYTKSIDVIFIAHYAAVSVSVFFLRRLLSYIFLCYSL